MKERTKKQVVVFIDIANNPNIAYEKVLRIARRYGHLVTVEAFGNFANGNIENDVAQQLFIHGIRCIHCPAWRNGSSDLKSTADETLMNTMRTLAYENPGPIRFILVSGDGHFVPTICEVKKVGHEVIVTSTENSTSRMLIEAANKFVPLPTPGNPVPREVYAALVKAVSSLQKDHGQSAVSIGRVKPRMIALLNGFDEKVFCNRRGHPFTRFSDFLRQAEELQWVRLIKDGNKTLVTTERQRKAAA